MHQGVDSMLQVGVGGVPASFKNHFETARCAEAGDNGRGGKVDFRFGILRHFFAYPSHYRGYPVGTALFPRF